MSILLLGHWDWGGDLRVDGSHQVEDGDQETIDRLVGNQEDEDNAWACELLVDSHREAIQMAYEEYVSDDDADIVDEVQGVEPVRA